MKQRGESKMKTKNALIILIGTIILAVLISMNVIDRNNEKADYNLYELGVEFYNNGNYDSAYTTFDKVINSNQSMNTKKLNKKFPDIVTYKNNSYDEIIYEKIEGYIKDGQNYQAAIEEAYKMIDTTRKDAIVADILYLVGE